MIYYYGLKHLILLLDEKENKVTDILKMSVTCRTKWLNIGGQLMTEEDVDVMKVNIRRNKINTWDELHDYYKTESQKYHRQKLQHAIASLFEIENIQPEKVSNEKTEEWLDKAESIKTNITEKIIQSRKKDYTNPFRKMVYDSEAEMDSVIGSFDDNSFIKEKQKELEEFRNKIKKLKAKLQT